MCVDASYFAAKGREYRRLARERRIAKLSAAKCEECKGPLPIVGFARKDRKFCSNSCGKRNWNRLWKERNGVAYNTAQYRARPRVDRDFTYAELEMRHCQAPGCNEPFEILGRYPGKYCSKACKSRAYRERKKAVNESRTQARCDVGIALPDLQATETAGTSGERQGQCRPVAS